MNKKLLPAFMALIAVVLFNTQSRAQSVLIYYWNFNINLTDTSIHTPDYKVTGSGSASYQYYGGVGGYIDFTNPGTFLNAQMSADSGGSLRVRVPADSVTFFLPTTGYGNIHFSYAVEKSGSGPTSDYIYYTTDGTNFIPAGTADPSDSSVYNVNPTWDVHTYTFGGVAAANNNPNFAIKISYGSAWAGAGNNRFDNVALKGDVLGTSGISATVNPTTPVYSIFPNPAKNDIEINCSTQTKKSVAINNVVGQTIYTGTFEGKHTSVNISSLNSGVYYVTIKENNTGNVSTLKFIKQ
jgi:Secretion system C-terminal sorting domain